MAPRREAEQAAAVPDPEKPKTEFEDNDVRDKTEDVVKAEEAVALMRVLCAMRGQKWEMPHAVEMAVGSEKCPVGELPEGKCRVHQEIAAATVMETWLGSDGYEEYARRREAEEESKKAAEAETEEEGENA